MSMPSAVRTSSHPVQGKVRIVWNRRLRSGSCGRAVLVCLLTATLVCLGSQRSVAGGPAISEKQYVEFRNWILEPATRSTTLQKMLDSPRPHATVYTQILEPIFNLKALTAQLDEEARRKLFVDLIKHLVEAEPEDDKAPLLFGPEIVRMVAADPVLLQHLLDSANGGLGYDPTKHEHPGWERIRQRALELLRDAKRPAELRRAAIRVAAECADARIVGTLAALWEALQAEASKLQPEDAAAFLDAAEKLLVYRFPDIDALVRFLSRHKDRFEGRGEWTDFEKEHRLRLFRDDVIALMSTKGGEAESQEHQAALDFGRRLIAKATTPEDLAVFFDAAKGSFVELQRAALLRAKDLEPAANEAWAHLLAGALGQSDDPVVLDALLALITETFTVRTKASDPLAKAVAERIADTRRQDSIAHRKDLATLLGRIGKLAYVRIALDDRRFSKVDDPQQEVWSRLIHAIGLVDDGLVVALIPYYLPRGVHLRPQLWERVATARALGFKAFHTNPLQRPQAALFLRHILTGEAGKAVELEVESDGVKQQVVRIFWGADLASPAAKQALEAGRVVLDLPEDPDGGDPAPEVRQAAMGSLEFYPDSADSAGILGHFAAGDAQSGTEALKVLSRMLARGSEGAARALATLVRQLEDEKRLLATLDAILGVDAPKSAAARRVLGEAVLTILQGKSASDGTRRKAAAVAAHLAYAPAIKPVSITWSGVARKEKEARAAWFGLLRDLVVAIAKAGAVRPGVDAQLADAMRNLADSPDTKKEVLSLFDAMGADGERLFLKRLRADLLSELAGMPEGGTRDERRAMLDTAIRLDRELVQQGAAASIGVLYRSIYDFLRERSKPEWLAEGEDSATFQLDAVKAAVLSGDTGTAKEALEQIVPALRKSALYKSKTAEIDAEVKKLEKLAGS